MKPALIVQGLSKKYPDFTLSDVTFSLALGRIMGLIGKNGAGKTTLLKSILDIVRPDSGNIEILGKPFLKNEIPCKRKIGVVLGGIDFYHHKKLADITAVTRRFYPNWDAAAYEMHMRHFELDAKKLVRDLSEGMKVKYLIALALSHHAELLILDEPTSGLDSVSRDDLLEMFLHIARSENIGILFSTHITSDLEKCADEITYIIEGKVLASAAKENFIESFQHLKHPGETGALTLEEIMVRTERGTPNV